MKKFLLFLPIGIITFFGGVGAFLGWILFELKYFRPIDHKQQTYTKRGLEQIVGNSLIKKLDKNLKIKCSDQTNRLIWKEFQKDPNFKDYVEEQLKKRYSMERNTSIDRNEAEIIGENLTEIFIECSSFFSVLPKDLNQDGAHEYFVKSDFRASENGFEHPLWIFQANENGLVKIFETQKSVFVITEPNLSKDYSDLKIWTIAKEHGHGCESLMTVETYSFDQNGYRKVSRKADGEFFEVAEKVIENEIFTKLSADMRFDWNESNSATQSNK